MTKEDNIRAVLETHFPGFREDIIESAVKMIMGVTKGRHGRWEDLHCTVCGKIGWSDEDDYCPNCGAKMDEVTDD